MRDLDEVFTALRSSSFRQRFKLGAKERSYLQSRGVETVLSHGVEFIAKRLAPAAPLNDGKQTPMRGHPVFIAQHATATCCRSCLARWHAIPAGAALTAAEEAHVLKAIERWLAGNA